MVAGAGHQRVCLCAHQFTRSAHTVFSVDGQWITAKKDYQEAKKRYKEQTKGGPADLDASSPPPPKEDVKNSTDGTYDKDMDAMRCILYLHGGGYYFGSVDQERCAGLCAMYISTLTPGPTDIAYNGWRAKSMAGCLVSVFSMICASVFINNVSSHQLPPCTAVSIPLCSARRPSSLCVIFLSLFLSGP